jgi:hypothetical protein
MTVDPPSTVRTSVELPTVWITVTDSEVLDTSTDDPAGICLKTGPADPRSGLY